MGALHSDSGAQADMQDPRSGLLMLWCWPSPVRRYYSSHPLRTAGGMHQRAARETVEPTLVDDREKREKNGSLFVMARPYGCGRP